MARTPKHVNVTVTSAQILELTTGYEDRLRRQADRIGKLVAFLEHKDLVDEFNEWCDDE